jgi:hypothetical protein
MRRIEENNNIEKPRKRKLKEMTIKKPDLMRI